MKKNSSVTFYKIPKIVSEGDIVITDRQPGFLGASPLKSLPHVSPAFINPDSAGVEFGKGAKPCTAG